MAVKQTAAVKKQQAWRNCYGAWAVVTGASEGIGYEIACALAEKGLNLVLVARRQAVLEELASKLNQQFGVQVQVLAVDLAQAQAVQQIIQATRALDVGLLVASAGFGTSGNLVEAPLEQELNMLDVNCRSVLALVHPFAQRFAAQQRGGLVMMSSLLAFQGVPRSANYAASKAYVQSLAEGLRLELAPLGVDVLSAAPGPVKTGFAARANLQMGMALHPRVVARQILEALGRKTTVRPGWLSVLLEGSLTGLPRNLRSRILGKVMQGMTKHQTA